MSISLLGKKIGMTQIFDKSGNIIPVTILQAGPCIITHIKTQEKDGYEAIQIGYMETHIHKISRAENGHLKKSNVHPLKYLCEYKLHSLKDVKLGDTITVDMFQIGNLVNVSGLSIGRGFTGYQKRHHFDRGPMSHGSKNHRQPGSIGAGTTPGRVFPGKKMAGRMGGKKITIKNLPIIDINPKNNLIIVKGSIPGKTGNLINIKSQ
uniref:Large ribosomal subunit protein uL3c n=1 Tax=Gelidium gabrielsonii TaxID=2483892 RepID=A0A3G2QXN1_9FLOR|nr:ribosomal protein L3 [Gelidium gabrielsonii]AYO27810.1 ribosomal protein L3 [Gelidium gabrielsonii]